jgi:aspartate/methionine/tyrosine aminotransferase
MFLVEELNKIDEIKCVIPGGAFYVFPKISKNNFSSKEISNYLLEKKYVATVPGSSFGTNGEGFVRISYASNIDNLKKSIVLIKEFINE